MARATEHLSRQPPHPTVCRIQSFWPTSQHEALLRAALLEPPRLQEALHEWRVPTPLAQIDYPSLTILPLLYRNLCRHRVAPELRYRTERIHRWSWSRNQLLLAALPGALAALREVDVDALVMKGAPLVLRAYADVGMRVMGDVDVVVRRNDLPRALEALGAAGWTPERSVTSGLVGSVGGVNLRDDRGRTLDLHWHVLPDNYDTRLDELLLQAADRIDIGTEHAYCLNPADHLLEVICHGLSWAANAPLHWIADAVTLLRTEQHRINWDRLAEQAGLNGRAYTVQSGLRYLAGHFDAPVPSSALEKLDRTGVRFTERAGFWFAQRSDREWAWGRVPLVVATYVRASRAQGQRLGLVGLVRFLSDRADCSPGAWLRRAGLEGYRHAGRVLFRGSGWGRRGRRGVRA